MLDFYLEDMKHYIAARDKSIKHWEDITIFLKPMQKQWKNKMTRSVLGVSGHLNLPTFYLMLIVSDFPDANIALDFVSGFNFVGNLPYSGVNPQHKVAASHTENELRKNAKRNLWVRVRKYKPNKFRLVLFGFAFSRLIQRARS